MLSHSTFAGQNFVQRHNVLRSMREVRIGYPEKVLVKLQLSASLGSRPEKDINGTPCRGNYALPGRRRKEHGIHRGSHVCGSLTEHKQGEKRGRMSNL